MKTYQYCLVSWEDGEVALFERASNDQWRLGYTDDLYTLEQISDMGDSRRYISQPEMDVIQQIGDAVTASE